MKIVILAPEAHGHVNPTLPLAAELTARGHEAVYFLPETFAPVAEASGAVVRRIEPIIEFPSDGSMPRMGRMNGAAGLTAEQQSAMAGFLAQLRANIEKAMPEIRERVEAEGANCVIYEAYGFWVVDVARALSGPKVAFFSTFAVPDGEAPIDVLSRAGGQVLPPELLAGKLGPMPFDMFTAPYKAEGLNVVPLPRSFAPDPAAFDDRYLFVGPSIRREVSTGDFPLERLEGRKVALVSLGTGLADPAFFNACFEAFAGTDWLVVAATGRTDAAQLTPPANVIARSHVPQLAVLERASVFVTHGGMNSTMEGLWFGVPLVVVPQHGDQPLVAQRVAALGVGRTLDPDGLTGPAIKEAVDTVAADLVMAENVATLQAEMRAGGGAARAADAVEWYAAAGGSAPILEPALSGLS